MNNQVSELSILGIGTALPPYMMEQADTANRLSEALSDQPDSARWARRIFKQCGVKTRYTCEPNLLAAPSECRYMQRSEAADIPTTAERMSTYKKEAVPLALAAAKEAMRDGLAEPANITHLITVSCTGQFLPGMDTVLIKQLELAPDVIRVPLNFIGCAAGLRAISLSKQLASGHPNAKVLIVCVELCTLHIQPSGNRDALFGASFFGDGASACVVGPARSEHRHFFQLGEDRSILLAKGTEEMVWEVGNFGFDLYLAPSIPKLIEECIPAEVEKLCKEDEVELWAIHPGGRGIVEAIQSGYGLAPEQVAPSLDVLRDVGNVSSATILFVLDAMRKQLQESNSDGAGGLALAFGPGLTAEMVRIQYIPAFVRDGIIEGEVYA